MEDTPKPTSTIKNGRYSISPVRLFAEVVVEGRRGSELELAVKTPYRCANGRPRRTEAAALADENRKRGWGMQVACLRSGWVKDGTSTANSPSVTQ